MIILQAISMQYMVIRMLQTQIRQYHVTTALWNGDHCRYEFDVRFVERIVLPQSIAGIRRSHSFPSQA